MLLIALLTQVSAAKDTGWLKAEGDGSLYVAGQGHLVLEGEGSLWYLELPEKGDLKAAEKNWKFRSGIGHFELDGRFVVVALGKGIKLEAEGRGRAHFIGKGTWETNVRKGVWRRRPHPVIYGAKGKAKYKHKGKGKGKGKGRGTDTK